jgi:acetyl esterase/lipase
MPSGAVLLCPWLDLTLSGQSYAKLIRKDPMLTNPSMKLFSKLYIGSQDPTNPFASPIFGDYHGFPPLMIQAGEHDILRSDAEKLAKKAIEQGVSVSFTNWKGMFHVWQFYGRILPEAERAVDEIGRFVRLIT